MGEGTLPGNSLGLLLALHLGIAPRGARGIESGLTTCKQAPYGYAITQPQNGPFFPVFFPFFPTFFPSPLLMHTFEN